MKKRSFFIVLAMMIITGSINMVSAQNAPVKRALLIIDVQNDYFEGGSNALSGSWEASVQAGKLLSEFRRSLLPVVHIQHLSAREGSTFFIPGTYGAQIHENVKPIKGETVINKNYPNSFRDTGLLEYLQANGITNLVICGMMSHMCVDATTRAAKDYGFNCVVISDACATKDLEVQGKSVDAANVQMAFMAALDYFYSTVQTTDEFMDSLE